MTVAELIEALEECDSDLTVVIDVDKPGQVVEVQSVIWSDKQHVALEVEFVNPKQGG